MLVGARDSGPGAREVRMILNDTAMTPVSATKPRDPGPEPRHV